MKSERILEAVGGINEEAVRDAKAYKKVKPKGWVKWGAMAACLCLVFGMAMYIQNYVLPDGPGEESRITVSDAGVSIPKLDVSLSNDIEADMIGFFIYQGNCYVHYEWLENAEEIVGEYLGTATGLIDEWTPKDGYVELAGSVKGDIYSVKGYAPSFMLCIVHESGDISTYVCNTGITLKYGSELYEDRIHLTGNYHTIQFETRSSWYQSKGEVYSLEDGVIVSSFIDALNVAEFIPWESVPSLEGHTTSSIYDTEIYHVYFSMDNGTVIHLRLYENGYVRFQGMLDICVQLPSEDYDAFIELLDASM